MCDTQLDTCLRIHGMGPFRPSTRNGDIIQTTVFQLCQHIKPELCAFIFGLPHI